ncbi:MAG: bifunctional DNA-binding transcriptional regulator/O6-methylguanine-DNA methyltransferase Ada [Proteobacteria bacterium]|nr:bifunctional DNA-binding transcriptional regulator/O6-methylguanine-DNA methyltransferase Ada [Pseudomonadota bacterium]
MTDEDRWQAVAGRDARFDGDFVFAVASTGIYCRPSCPSRRPRRRNVSFYGVPEAAEHAGYRACLRCRPRDVAARDARIEAVRSVCRYIEEHGDGPPTLAALGAHVNLSPHHLQRSFKAVIGVTPRQYYDARRLDRLKRLLRDGDAVTGALYEAGYGSSSRLYEKAPAQLGMTPATYRRGGEGARIGYTIAASPLDRLLVGATARGVCALYLGGDDGALEAALDAEYPAADITRDDAGLGPWVDAVLAHLEGRAPDLDLPLDVRATAFQRQVWEALRAIPYGETRSYGEVARAIGRPTAARAVARACATNRVSVVVPCHRVVRGDGGLGGYRWGTERKKALLAKERATVGGED